MENRSLRTRRETLGGALRRSLLAAAVLTSTTLFGCAFGEFRPDDPFNREYSLEQAQHTYTLNVRWGQFQKAKAFVAKDERDDYLARMEAFEDAHFTDYESDPVEVDHEKEMATITVRYLVYFANSPFEVEIEETQEWTRSGVRNNWRVHSVFEPLPGLAAN